MSFEYAKILTDPAKMQYGYGVSGKRSEVATLGYMIFLHGAGGELLTEDYPKQIQHTRRFVCVEILYRITHYA